VTATVATLTRPGSTVRPVRAVKQGNQKVVYRDYTLDTGTYTAGGLTITAASVGMKAFDFVTASGNVATSGTAGATGNPVGITYATEGTSITLQLYEGSAAATALGEKDTAEAVPSNFTIRLKFEGI
jgi:hypothetical protein